MSVACQSATDLKDIEYCWIFHLCCQSWGRRAEGKRRYKHTECYLRHVLIRDQYIRGSGQICWPF